MHNQINFKLLKKQVTKSVHSLSLEDIKHQECLDLQGNGNVPSIIYSMTPLDINFDPRDFKFGFASNYITELASAKMIYEYSNQLNFLFATMQNQRIGGSLIGQIFENLVIESINTKKLSQLNGKILTGDDEFVGNEINLNFNDFISQDYDANDGNLYLLIERGNCTNFFLTPIQSNAAAVDAIYYDSIKDKLYFLQMTISMIHDFKLIYLQKLADSFRKHATQIEMIFLVPENCYQNFNPQNPLTFNGRIMKRIPRGFRQSVMRIPRSVYSLNSHVDI